MPNGSADMLAFTYRIQKIIRDMRHLPLADEEAQYRRQHIIDALDEVNRRIEEGFAAPPAE